MIPISLTVRVALRALLTNKFRSLLTILGMVIGVAALIATWSISQGARLQVQERLDQFGKDSIWVYGGTRGKWGVKGGSRQSVDLKIHDWQVVSGLSSIEYAAPILWGEAQLVYGANNWHSEFIGTAPEYLPIRRWAVAQGRMFSEDEIRAGATVAVLGSQVAQRLFGASDGLGKLVRINQFSFHIVGILEERGQDGGRSSQDDTFLVPYTTVQRRLYHTSDIHMILAGAKPATSLKPVAEHIVEVLKQRNNVPKDETEAYRSYTSETAFKTYQDGTKTFGLLTLLTASVCLLVGGIGITNTMMISVGERTREIGIRLALGARPNDILTQFLVEALVLSSLGGGLGVVLGLLAAVQTANLASWPPVITISSLVFSFACSSLIGLISGVYPAYKASRLDPVEALRTD
jgi:putative ABC transport system permease protein